MHFCSTQLPQAVGVAYSLKMDRKDACVVTYIGDGGTSEVKHKILLYFNLKLPAPPSVLDIPWENVNELKIVMKSDLS